MELHPESSNRKLEGAGKARRRVGQARIQAWKRGEFGGEKFDRKKFNGETGRGWIISQRQKCVERNSAALRIMFRSSVSELSKD
jgi:hypothetical protein